MADDNKSPGEQQFDPTPGKLERAREAGDVPRSSEAGAAIALFVLAFAFLHGGPLIGRPLVEMVRRIISFEALRTLETGQSLLPLVATSVARATLPLICMIAAVGAFHQLAEMGFRLPSGENAGLKVDFSRLDLVRNIRERYGLKLVFDATKNVLKLALVTAVLAYSTYEIFEKLEGLIALSPQGFVDRTSTLIGQTVLRVAMATVLIVGLDYGFARYRYMRKQRMSKQELKEELKRTEGNPQMKAARKSRQREIALGQALKTVDQATVLVANPTHYSVTLRYLRDSDAAPIVLGRGHNRLALRMRDKAREHGVPIVENKPLARALYAVGKEGQPIPVDFYKAVAEVLAYVLAPAGSGALPPPPAEIPQSAKKAVARLDRLGREEGSVSAS